VAEEERRKPSSHLSPASRACRDWGAARAAITRFAKQEYELKTPYVVAAIVAVGLGVVVFFLPEITSLQLVKVALQQSVDRFPQASASGHHGVLGLFYSTVANLLTSMGFEAAPFNVLATTWALVLSICASILAYLTPSFIAEERKHRYRLPIFLLNVFTGWTFFGWVAALVWAAMPVNPPPLPAVLPEIERQAA
jgi:MFS family permease